MGRRACGFVIFRRFQGTIEYLLLQAANGVHHWCPPKGKNHKKYLKKQRILNKKIIPSIFKGYVDKGENDMEAAIRETREETGIQKNDLKIFEDAKQELSYQAWGKQKTVIYWLAELINSNKELKISAEHQASTWLPLEEACKQAGYEDLQNILGHFDKYISDKSL